MARDRCLHRHWTCHRGSGCVDVVADSGWDNLRGGCLPFSRQRLCGKNYYYGAGESGESTTQLCRSSNRISDPTKRPRRRRRRWCLPFASVQFPPTWSSGSFTSRSRVSKYLLYGLYLGVNMRIIYSRSRTRRHSTAILIIIIMSSWNCLHWISQAPKEYNYYLANSDVTSLGIHTALVKWRCL